MTWDATKPAGTDSIRQGDDIIRELKVDIAAALTAEGSFPGPDTLNPKFRWTPPKGTTAARPAAGAASATGRLYINSDEKTIQRDTGAAWENVTPPTNIMPTGAILPYGANIGTVPQGYLYCNGQAVSRTTYADLFAVLGTSWGQGDGATTFNVPDLRGTFLRGRNDGASDAYQDPDSATRVARLTGGTTGDNAGSFQADEFEAHTHAEAGVVGVVHNLAGGGNAALQNTAGTTGSAGGSTESRPRNASVSFIIKT